MARLTKRYQVLLVVRSAARERQDVMHLRGGRCSPARLTLRAQGVRHEEPRANLLPLMPVAFLRRRVTVVAVVVPGLGLGVLLAEARGRQLRASGVRARVRWFAWHSPSSVSYGPPSTMHISELFSSLMNSH